MGDTISLENALFISSVGSLSNRANTLAAEGAGTPEISGNSEALRDYIACMEEIKGMLSAYRSFLSSDAERIRSAGETLKAAEKELLLQP